MDKLQHPLFEKPMNAPLYSTTREPLVDTNGRLPFNRKENGRGKHLNSRSNERSIDQFYPNRKFNSTYGGKELHFPEKMMQFNKIPKVEFDHAKSMSVFEQDRNARYKTEICRNFKERLTCIYGNQCQFAHGKQELRDSMKSNKYKTKCCDKYWGTGYCVYGPRCNYLHYEADEKSENEMFQRYSDNSMNEEPIGKNILLENVEDGSDKSDSFLAETVKEVMDQIQKDKLRCDPKLEELFVKLKRALPTKNNPKSVNTTSSK